MKRQIAKGTSSLILELFVLDASKNDGSGLTGLVFNTSNLRGYYHRNTAAAAVQISLVDMTLGTFTSGGFKQVDATNMPGVYQLCLPDAALAAGADSVSVMLRGAANMPPVLMEIELTATNNQDSIRAGLAALPSANAGATGGLPTVNASGAVKAVDEASSALATASNLAAVATSANTARDEAVLCRKLLKASAFVDTATTPWNLVLIEQGTGGLGVGTELLRQTIKDVNGNNIASTDIVPGRTQS